MNWEKFKGKLLHIVVETVYPYGPGEDQVTIRLIETGEYIQFRVDTEENNA